MATYLYHCNAHSPTGEAAYHRYHKSHHIYQRYLTQSQHCNAHSPSGGAVYHRYHTPIYITGTTPMHLSLDAAPTYKSHLRYNTSTSTKGTTPNSAMLIVLLEKLLTTGTITLSISQVPHSCTLPQMPNPPYKSHHRCNKSTSTKSTTRNSAMLNAHSPTGEAAYHRYHTPTYLTGTTPVHLTTDTTPTLIEAPHVFPSTPTSTIAMLTVFRRGCLPQVPYPYLSHRYHTRAPDAAPTLQEAPQVEHNTYRIPRI